jgi:hypothetical protein
MVKFESNKDRALIENNQIILIDRKHLNKGEVIEYEQY